MAAAKYRRVSFDVREGGDEMHSHDRTLLSALGFSDKDKRDPRHDLACQYLRQPDVLLKLFGGVEELAPVIMRDGTVCAHLDAPDGTYVHDEDRCGEDEYDSYSYSLYNCKPPKGASVKEIGKPNIHCEAQLECALSKGEEQYKTTIGFLDVSGKITISQKVKARWPLVTADYKKTTRTWAEWAEEQTRFVIEVKMGPVSTGDALRQLALYREYTEPDVWALVVGFDVDEGFVETLAEHDVTCARLGADFETWLKRRKRKAAKAAPVRTL